MWRKAQLEVVQIQITKLVLPHPSPWQNPQGRDNQESWLIIYFIRKEGCSCHPFPFLYYLALLVSAPLHQLQGWCHLSVELQISCACRTSLWFYLFPLECPAPWSARDSFHGQIPAIFIAQPACWHHKILPRAHTICENCIQLSSWCFAQFSQIACALGKISAWCYTSLAVAKHWTSLICLFGNTVVPF